MSDRSEQERAIVQQACDRAERLLVNLVRERAAWDALVESAAGEMPSPGILAEGQDALAEAFGAADRLARVLEVARADAGLPLQAGL